MREPFAFNRHVFWSAAGESFCLQSSSASDFSDFSFSFAPIGGAFHSPLPPRTFNSTSLTEFQLTCLRNAIRADLLCDGSNVQYFLNPLVFWRQTFGGKCPYHSCLWIYQIKHWLYFPYLPTFHCWSKTVFKLTWRRSQTWATGPRGRFDRESFWIQLYRLTSSRSLGVAAIKGTCRC